MSKLGKIVDGYNSIHSELDNNTDEREKPVASERVQTFIDTIEKAYKKQFPKAWISVSYNVGMGEHISMLFGIQNPKKWANNIEHNDPARHVLMIHDLEKGDFGDDRIQLDVASGTTLSVDPAPDSHYAFDSVKTGLRKKTGTVEQVTKHLLNYFKKLRKVVDDNKDRISKELE